MALPPVGLTAPLLPCRQAKRGHSTTWQQWPLREPNGEGTHRLPPGSAPSAPLWLPLRRDRVTIQGCLRCPVCSRALDLPVDVWDRIAEGLESPRDK